MSTSQAHLVHPLRDVCATEIESEVMLAAPASRFADDPQMRMRIGEHLHKTHNRRAVLEGCLSRPDSGQSLIKGMAGQRAGFERSSA
jgi:ferritin-like metal-binding protein YciE